MQLIDDDALILDHSPFRDRHLLVTALTRGHGLIRGVLRRARGGRNPAGAATQVLSLVHLDAHLKTGAEMATYRQVDLLRSSYPLASDLPAATASAVVAELLITFCPPLEVAERRFRLGTACLDALLAGVDPELIVTYSQLWMLSLSGLLPLFDLCSGCGVEVDFAIVGTSDGQPRCKDCAAPNGEVLSQNELRFLATCRSSPVTDIGSPVPTMVARWFDHLVRREAERPLRALDFMRRHAGNSRD